MVRRVTWSLEAKADRKNILAYWDKRNGSKAYSKKLYLEINELIKVLQAFPAVGMQTSNPKVRYFIVDKYLLFYTSLPTELRILRLWDGRQALDRQPFLR